MGRSKVLIGSFLSIVMIVIGLALWYSKPISLPERVTKEPYAEITELESKEDTIIKYLSVHFIDIEEHGDSILVISPNGSTMLIDAGGPERSGEKIVSYLKKAGITAIDILVATHPHKDHIGGMPHIFKNFEIGTVYDNGQDNHTKEYQAYIELLRKNISTPVIGKRGDFIPLDEDIELEILHSKGEYKRRNDSSLVLKLTYGEVTFLFAADAEAVAEKEMINYYGDKLKAIVLKVGHHGLKTSSTQAFIEKVKPQIAVIQSGKNTKAPHKKVVNRLKKNSAEIYMTANEGTIVITSDGISYFID